MWQMMLKRLQRWSEKDWMLNHSFSFLPSGTHLPFRDWEDAPGVDRREVSDIR
jgi:hypothetical protein